MTETALTTYDPTQLPSAEKADDNFKGLSSSDNFLKRLQLYGKGKAIDKGLIQPGRFGVPHAADDIEDLGKSVDLLIFGRRPKAIDMSDIKNLIIVYERNDPEFARIEEESANKDSGCMYGTVYLVYERNTKTFYELFFGTKSARKRNDEMSAHMTLTQEKIDKLEEDGQDVEGLEPRGPLPVTVKAEYIEGGGWSWFAPEPVTCSVPIEGPSVADVVKECTRFHSEKDTDVVAVDEDSGGRAR